METNQSSLIDLERFKIHKRQLHLQYIQVILSTVLVFFIIKSSMKKQNLPDSFIEDDED